MILEHLSVEKTKPSTTWTTHKYLILTHIYIFISATRPRKSQNKPKINKRQIGAIDGPVLYFKL